MRRLADWFQSHPLTTIFLGIIGFAVGVHLFANWRAEVRWQRYAAEARARGVKLTLTEFAPPEIPDAENFAALPMFRAIFNGGPTSPLDMPFVQGKKPSPPNAAKGERLDWLALQKFCKDAGWIAGTTDSPPRDVLRGLEHYAPQFQQWREWPARPRCRFPLELDKGVAMQLPHLSTFVNAARLFALRMRANLALGDSPAAYADFLDGLQAYRALADEPVLISGLVRISALFTVLNAVGEGLRDRAWSEAELKRIDAELARLAVWEDYRLAFATEHAAGNWFYDKLAASTPWQRAGFLDQFGASMGQSYPATLMGLIPRRMIRDNQLRQNQYFDELTARVSADGRSYNPDLPTPSDAEHLTGFLDPYYFFLCRISLPVFGEVIHRYVRLQTLLDQTRTAIALQRFHLAHGTYPETLAALVPEFLAAVPVDTYARQPLRYRRQDDGSFLLYGVGKNRTDDGGKLDPKLGEHKQPDDLWLYAPPPQ